MSDATMWFVLAGVLVALELMTGSFYLLMLGLGALAAALAALAGHGLSGMFRFFQVAGGCPPWPECGARLARGSDARRAERSRRPLGA